MKRTEGGTPADLGDALTSVLRQIVRDEVRRLLPAAIEEMTATLTAVDRTRVYSVTEAATISRLSEDTIRRACRDRTLISAQVGRVFRIPGDALHRFLSGGAA